MKYEAFVVQLLVFFAIRFIINNIKPNDNPNYLPLIISLITPSNSFRSLKCLSDQPVYVCITCVWILLVAGFVLSEQE